MIVYNYCCSSFGDVAFKAWKLKLLRFSLWRDVMLVNLELGLWREPVMPKDRVRMRQKHCIAKCRRGYSNVGFLFSTSSFPLPPHPSSSTSPPPHPRYVFVFEIACSASIRVRRVASSASRFWLFVPRSKDMNWWPEESRAKTCSRGVATSRDHVESGVPLSFWKDVREL